MIFRRILAALACASAVCSAHAADGGAMALHLLDYIASDYPNAVEGGRVKSEDEYRR